MKKWFILTAGLLFFFPVRIQAQGSITYDKGLTFNLNNDPNRYIRLLIFNQIWFRYSELNPGTAIDGIARNNVWSVVNRRLRFLFYAQLHKRYMVLGHVGVNSQTFNSGGSNNAVNPGRNPFLYFHDAWNEFAVILPEDLKNVSLNIGAGLHYWTGLSRITQGGTINPLGIDYNSYNWPLIDAYDQFGRPVGVFVKGYIGNLNYVFNFSKPFTQKNLLIRNDKPIINEAVLNNQKTSATNFSTAGYINYDFFEHESMKLPYRIGTYGGDKKKYFSVGSGYYYQPDATISQERENAALRQHPIVLIATDFFLNYPLGKAKHPAVFNAYGVYYNYNFGPNYIRHIGTASIGQVNTDIPENKRALSGPGIAQPTIGTGQIVSLQAGYVFPSQKEKPVVRFQPFGIYYFKNFDYFQIPAHQFDAGMNFYFDGHHAKVILQYSSRPVYLSRQNAPSYKGDWIIGCQVLL